MSEWFQSKNKPTRPRARRWLGMALFLFSISTLGADRWRVVILPGADPTQPAVALQIRAIRSALSAVAPNGVEFYTDSLDQLRFDNTELIPEFLALMKKKYERNHVDIVIGIADFSLEFTRRYHDEIWPNVPVLITSIDESRVPNIPPNFAYLTWHFDADGTIALAEALQPHARRLVVVSGNSNFDRFTSDLARQAARARTSRKWTTDEWVGLTLPELKERLAKLDQNTAVIYTTMYRDRDARTYFPFEPVAPMTQASTVPIYGWYPTYLGHGLAGGAVIDYETNGRRAGELAASILQGKVTADGATLPKEPSRCTVDRAQLDRLKVSAALIPSQCEQINVPQSLWNQYRWTVLVAVAVVMLQAVTIACLLWHRRRRHIAEEAAGLRASELARAARFASAGELSASIAHEVGQPLGAILSNADAAGMVLDQREPEVGELQHILADIRRDAVRASQVVQRLRALLQRQPVEFTQLDLNGVLDETLALLAPESRRRGIPITANLSAGCAPIVGDRIQLQQVLLNLAMNAMDAMDGVEPEIRQINIATREMQDGVELSVADRGHGVPKNAKKVFESFYTTKSNGMGLGLSIVRTIVESHGGTVTAESRSGGGSVFIVWLPAARTERAPRAWSAFSARAPRHEL
ncbi:ATP-binding protein [Caballeronia sp. PC1]|uniref:sensor histidine kinase n=2 Tax=unclassified Caballeronia TaxID=2646786 RepID=UPI001F36544C|nr:ATP-binding protein [Caballeronia sp. PC1]MCE4546037.1 sensor histidine kinase [Caballeronia sp. PC1]